MRRKLVTACEIRRLLNLGSNSRVYDLARRAMLPGVVRIGRQVRFDLEKVRDFVDRGGQTLPGGWRRSDNALKAAAADAARSKNALERGQ